MQSRKQHLLYTTGKSMMYTVNPFASRHKAVTSWTQKHTQKHVAEGLVRKKSYECEAWLIQLRGC